MRKQSTLSKKLYLVYRCHDKNLVADKVVLITGSKAYAEEKAELWNIFGVAPVTLLSPWSYVVETYECEYPDQHETITTCPA